MRIVKWAFAIYLLTLASASAQERVDANIVTGIDVSMSVDAKEVQAQVAYMVAAMQSTEVQARIAHGRYKRIGFAVYLWSAGCAPIIDWRVVSTPEDLEAVVVDLVKATALVARAQGENKTTSGLTDTSNAMMCGLEAIKNSPYATYRDVLNIVTNGTDNVGGPVMDAKLLAEQMGVTVNAMITPGGGVDNAMFPFLETYVKTGGTSFVIRVDTGEKMIDGWIRKFIGDMV